MQKKFVCTSNPGFIPKQALSLSLVSGYTPAVRDQFFLLDDTSALSLAQGTFANAPLTGSVFRSFGVQRWMQSGSRKAARSCYLFPESLAALRALPTI